MWLVYIPGYHAWLFEQFMQRQTCSGAWLPKLRSQPQPEVSGPREVGVGLGELMTDTPRQLTELSLFCRCPQCAGRGRCSQSFLCTVTSSWWVTEPPSPAAPPGGWGCRGPLLLLPCSDRKTVSREAWSHDVGLSGLQPRIQRRAGWVLILFSWAPRSRRSWSAWHSQSWALSSHKTNTKHLHMDIHLTSDVIFFSFQSTKWSIWRSVLLQRKNQHGVAQRGAGIWALSFIHFTAIYWAPTLCQKHARPALAAAGREIRSTSVMVNVTCQLDWPWGTWISARYPWCVRDGALDEITFKTLDWVKQAALLNVGGPRPISWRLVFKKKKIHWIRGTYTGLTAFQTKIPAFILPLSLNWNVSSSWVLRPPVSRQKPHHQLPCSSDLWTWAGTKSVAPDRWAPCRSWGPPTPTTTGANPLQQTSASLSVYTHKQILSFRPSWRTFTTNDQSRQW